MERNQLLAEVKRRLPERRYTHTVGVMTTAIQLAEQYDADADKAATAAILHDIAKYEAIDTMETIVREQALDERLLGWGSEILHGPVGAYYARTQFGVTDENILQAITYHTTGRANMSQLEQIIFVADMIEPSRNFPGVERLRKKAQNDLQKAVRACVIHSLTFLISTKQTIFPETLQCYNDMIGEK